MYALYITASDTHNSMQQSGRAVACAQHQFIVAADVADELITWSLDRA